jgi:hypothetical protein
MKNKASRSADIYWIDAEIIEALTPGGKENTREYLYL